MLEDIQNMIRQYKDEKRRERSGLSPNGDNSGYSNNTNGGFY